MKHALFTGLLIFLCSGAYTQGQRFNIVFKPDQKVLADPQIKEINFLAARLMEGETVVLYPLAYDSIYDVFKYTSNAMEQARAIAEYAASIGFEYVGTPRNFPSSYSGLSVGVILKYLKSPVPNPQGNQKPLSALGLQGHFPEKPSQYFVIDPLKDTLIIGNEGTKLLFKAGSLLCSKKVQIELKEFYKLEDYVKNGLPTISNGRMIQTGGSIYLNARENDGGKKQVNINPEKGVAVDFTLGKNDADMEIFIKDPRSPKTLNWILPPKRWVTESWQMTEIVYGPDGKVISEKKYNSKEEWEQHVKEEEKKEADRKKNEAIKQETMLAMESKLEIYNLGYINCDKFYNEATMPLSLAADEKLPAEYYLVYTDIRGLMKGNVSGQKVSFSSVAKDRSAVLIAVCFVDKQAYYFKTSIGPGGKLSAKIALLPVEENFLNQELALLK